MLADTPESRELSPADALEAALDWWREAGVEDDYLNEPTSWLADPLSKQAVTSPKPKKPPAEPQQTPMERAFIGTANNGAIGGNESGYPATLEKFREWWISEATLSSAGVAERIPPRGLARAKLMILMPEPMSDDSDSLLSGKADKFVEAMTRAMGIAPHETYLASALPAPISLPDWADLANRGLASVTIRHIALADPHRVLVLGRSLAPLFGVAAEDAREPAVIRTDEKTLPLLLAPELAELARSAPRRRAFWDRWLDWTA